MYIGSSLKRREDERFLRGRGTFVDDLTLPNMTYAAFVRSPHAHAAIKGFTTEKAKALPGVLAVLTGADWSAEGLGRAPCLWAVPFRDGRPMNEVTLSILASDRVVFIGEPVAIVVAETAAQALDAAEAVEVDYEPQPAVVETAHALDSGAPLVHPDFGTNLAFDWEIGDEMATDAAFAQAAHVTSLEHTQNRICPAYMEPRAAIGHYDSAHEHYTLWATLQNPHMQRRWLAEQSLYIPEHKIRVVSPDVGGGFGPKFYHYPEYPTLLWASRKLDRPVRWTETRSECFVVDHHARDHVTACKMAFAEDGKILAIRTDTIAALGAYCSTAAPVVPCFGHALLPSLYTVPAVYAGLNLVYTNSTPVDAYRGAGRPEVHYVVERLLENGAREMGIDVCTVRERNFIQAEQFPHTTSTDVTYDSGDPPGLMRTVKGMGDYQSLRDEQARLRNDGVLMGIGLAGFMDCAAMGPSKIGAQEGARQGWWDSANVRVHPTGKVTVLCASHNHGQAQETTFAQIAADKLGVDFDDVEIVVGDTDRAPFGIGTGASRSITLFGTAITMGAERIVEKGRKLAAHLMECALADVEYENGAFVVKGTDRQMTFQEIAGAAYYGADYPDDFELGLDETAFYDPDDYNYPSALHLCTVLVDPETGLIRLRDYFVVDDCGRVINPMVVEGQIHGGLVQGIGQALMEHCIYEPESGQNLTGTFMDYGMPRAEDVPNFGCERLESLSPNNPLGVKGAGESGTIGAPAAMVNAVVDGLWHLGVRHVEMPMTPMRVRQAIEAAGH